MSPPSTSGTAGIPGPGNQTNTTQPSSTQGTIQNQAVSVTAGATSSLNPSVQQLTQPQAPANVNWSLASITTPQVAPGTLTHPHFSAAIAVADFTGQQISLDRFAECIAARAAALSMPGVQGPSDSQLNQAFMAIIRPRIETRSLSLDEVAMTIEDTFPWITPQPLHFPRDQTQGQVRQQLTGFLTNNPDVDRILCEVKRADGNGQPSIEGLYRDPQTQKWHPIGETRPLPDPYSDRQNFRADGSVISPAIFFAMRHPRKVGGDSQQAGLSLLTLTPAQRPQRTNAPLQQQHFSQATPQPEVARQLANFFTAHPEVDTVHYTMHPAVVAGQANPPVTGILYRQEGKWWSQSPLLQNDANNTDIDGSLIDPAAFLALRHSGAPGGDAQQIGLSLQPLRNQQSQPGQSSGMQQQLQAQSASSNTQTTSSSQSTQSSAGSQAGQSAFYFINYTPSRVRGMQAITPTTVPATSAPQSSANNSAQIQSANRSSRRVTSAQRRTASMTPAEQLREILQNQQRRQRQSTSSNQSSTTPQLNQQLRVFRNYVPPATSGRLQVQALPPPTTLPSMIGQSGPYQFANFRPQTRHEPIPVEERSTEDFRQALRSSRLDEHIRLNGENWALPAFDFWLERNPYTYQDPNSGAQTQITRASELASLPTEAWNNNVSRFFRDQSINRDIPTLTDLLGRYRTYWQTGRLT